MKKTYGELIEYYENVSPREIIADMYFDYKEEIDNLNNLGKQLVEENEQLKVQLQQKENIIKEVGKMLYKRDKDDYDTYTANVLCDIQSDFEEILRGEY